MLRRRGFIAGLAAALVMPVKPPPASYGDFQFSGFQSLVPFEQIPDEETLSAALQMIALTGVPDAET